MASQPPLPTSVPRKYAANSFWGARERAIKLKKKGFYKQMAREAAKQAEKMSA